MRRHFPQRAHPPFRARQRGRVNVDFPRFRNIRCRRLKRLHVRSMPKLGLKVAAQDTFVGDERGVLG